MRDVEVKMASAPLCRLTSERLNLQAIVGNFVLYTDSSGETGVELISMTRCIITAIDKSCGWSSEKAHAVQQSAPRQLISPL